MTIASIYASIGPAGVALVLLALAGVYLATRTWYYLRVARRNFRLEYFRLEKAGQDARWRGPAHNPALAIVREMVTAPNAADTDVKSEVSYRFHRNFETVFRNLSWIRFISIVSPLLGLLGTVLGMLTVFRVVSENAAPDAALLAAGIWEALITTVMGLTVAIPTLMAHYYLKLLMKGFYIQTVECTVRALARAGADRGGSAPAASREAAPGAAVREAAGREAFTDVSGDGETSGEARKERGVPLWEGAHA